MFQRSGPRLPGRDGPPQNLGLKKAEQRILEAKFPRNARPATFSAADAEECRRLPSTARSARTSPRLLFLATSISTRRAWLASWELDFWGKFRRDLESANADLDAADDNYKDVLVILFGDVATQLRAPAASQQRLAYVQRNVEIQKGTLESARQRFKAGKSPEMDVQQARINLTQTESTIPPLVTGLWEANNQLCVLLGIRSTISRLA